MANWTADQVITRAYVHAMRKATPPASGTSKYNALLAIVDSMQKLWANEPDIEWDVLYKQWTLAATASVTTTIPLDTGIDHLSMKETDPVLIGTNAYKVVKPSQLYANKYNKVCAVINGVLTFPQALDSSLVGLSVTVPAITTVADITSGSQTITVPDPMWLAYATAAEFARNDTVKGAQYNNLLTLADEHMRRMKNDNSAAADEVDLPVGWISGESWC